MSTMTSDIVNSRKNFSLCCSNNELILIFGGIDPHSEYGLRGNTGRDIYRYNLEDNNWKFVGEMPEPRHHHSVVYLMGRLYLIGKQTCKDDFFTSTVLSIIIVILFFSEGGADPREDDVERSVALGTVWSFDPKNKKWYNEPNLITPRQNFGLVVDNGKIYVIGGQNENGMLVN